jgi:hypothetical protein
MKQYLLSIVQPDGPKPPAEFLQQVMQDVGKVMQELRTSGSWVFSGGLHPASAASVVRWRDGEACITDGPFAEGKEHVGGFVVIKAGDLDQALQWARRFAKAITLPIEVRSFEHVGEP